MNSLAQSAAIVVIALLLVPLGFSPVLAKDEPIHIEADRMISQEMESSVMFTGDVEARQGDVTIRCQEMTVFYEKKEVQQKKTQVPNTSGAVSKLTCKEAVEIIQGNWLGVSKRMDYFAKERKVVLIGDAKAWQGQNMVAGKSITYYLDDKRSVVERDEKKSGRVSATLHPSSK